jgi:hypothetical protein
VARKKRDLAKEWREGDKSSDRHVPKITRYDIIKRKRQEIRDFYQRCRLLQEFAAGEWDELLSTVPEKQKK